MLPSCVFEFDSQVNLLTRRSQTPPVKRYPRIADGIKKSIIITVIPEPRVFSFKVSIGIAKGAVKMKAQNPLITKSFKLFD